jgi:hypothetical protein
MSKEPEVRYFPIPKNLKEMNSDELHEYAAKLADHVLQQAQDEKNALEASRFKKLAFKSFRAIAVLTGAFFYFVSLLQFQDDFIGYGFVSVGIGTLLLAGAFTGKITKLLKERFGNK